MLNPSQTVESNEGELRLKLTPRGISAAGEILSRWLDEGATLPLDRLVQNELRKRHQFNSGERRWVSNAVYGSVRHLQRQELRLKAEQLPFDGTALAELWSRDRSDENSVDPELSPAAYLRDQLSFPEHLASELEAQLNGEAIAAGRAFNRQAPTTLRINPLKTTREVVIDRLGVGLPTRYSPWGVELPGRVNVHDTPGFREGWFEIQEEASQLAALLAAPMPGGVVIDVGCGAGGKTLAMAAMMNNRGQVHAIDVSADRLDELAKRALRAGVKTVRRHLAEVDVSGRWMEDRPLRSPIKNLQRRGDVVLVDAPCTGAGVIRRSPDAKWRNNDIGAFTALQFALLQQSAELVAPKGVLIYVTCTFEAVQNEEIVSRFLASPAGHSFSLLEVAPRLANAIARSASAGNGNEGAPADQSIADLTSGPYFRTWPHRHDLDAFFAACLIRHEVD